MASHDLHCSPEMCGVCREYVDNLYKATIERAAEIADDELKRVFAIEPPEDRLQMAVVAVVAGLIARRIRELVNE